MKRGAALALVVLTILAWTSWLWNVEGTWRMN
jgi:hypothetical protein